MCVCVYVCVCECMYVWMYVRAHNCLGWMGKHIIYNKMQVIFPFSIYDLFANIFFSFSHTLTLSLSLSLPFSLYLFFSFAVILFSQRTMWITWMKTSPPATRAWVLVFLPIWWSAGGAQRSLWPLHTLSRVELSLEISARVASAIAGDVHMCTCVWASVICIRL